MNLPAASYRELSSNKIAPRFYMPSAAGGLEKGNSCAIKLTTLCIAAKLVVGVADKKQER